MAAGPMDESKRFYLYKEHPKACAPDEFWAQVKRTVNGKPVGEDQIQLIVEAILDGLQIDGADTLLDLCCGNGALTDRIFARCQGGLGIDFSEPLIAVAEHYFQSVPRRVYRLDDVESYLQSAQGDPRYTKALCYGAFQYLPKQKAINVLRLVRNRFPNVKRLFIGNLPDKERMRDFFKERVPPPNIADDPGSPIGIWRTEAEFATLAQQCGWNIAFRQMPRNFYAAAYRYDAVLTPSIG